MANTKMFLAPSFRLVPLADVPGCRLPTSRSLPALEAKKNIKMATQGDISGTLLCPSVWNVAEVVTPTRTKVACISKRINGEARCDHCCP